MEKLDKIIISELSKNSRIKLKEISYLTNISKQAVLTKIIKLIEANSIFPYSITNYFNSGKNNIHLHIKFEKMNFEEINKIISSLVKKISIVWIAETFHKYDLSISIIYVNFKTVENLIQEIKNLSSNNIKMIDISFIKENYYFSFDYNNSNNKKLIKISKTYNKEVKLRKNEEILIKLISSNGRFKLTELGNKLNLTPNSVKYMIKELEKKEIILGYGTFINYLKLNYRWFQIIIETSLDEKYLNQLFKIQNIIFLSKTFDGKLIIDFISKNTDEVRDFISKIEIIFGKINKYDIYEIIKIHKLENPNKEN